MVTAAIKINGALGSQDNLSIGVAAILTNSNDAGVTSWLWQLLSRPPGSSATIGIPTNPTASLTPDIVGSYLIKLTVSDGVDSDDDQVIGAVLTSKLSMRIPAAGEEAEFDLVNGWAQGVHAALLTIDTTLGTHTIGGSIHTSSTLAQLNAKISDANLDDDGDPRPPNGTAGGDLSDTYPNPTVTQIQGNAIESDPPTDGYALVWNSGASEWQSGEVSTTTAFIDLTDTPANYSSQAGKLVIVKSIEDGMEFSALALSAYATKSLLDAYATPDIVDGYAKDFIDLADVPNSYTGQNGKIVVVKATEDGLEFSSSGGATNLQQAYDGGRIINADNGPMEIDAYGEEALNLDGYLGIAHGNDPQPLDNKGLVYVKEIGSTHQLFYMDNAGTAYQLTSRGQGLEATVDTSVLGLLGMAIGPFPFPPSNGVNITVAQGEDVIVTFSAYVDPGASVNPFENIYARLELDSVPVFVNKVTVFPIITGTEASDISFSYLLTNLPAGLRSITMSVDTGTAPADPAGFAAINTPVLGAARVFSSANVTLQKAYQNDRHIYTSQGAPVHIDAYDAYEGLNIDGYIGLNPLIEHPEPIGEKGLVYTSSVDGYSELFYLDDYGMSSQITSKGSAGGSITLNQAYDGEAGSGSGRIITVDSGPVQLNVSGNDSGLTLISMGDLDGNAIFESYVESNTNSQIGNWFQFIGDGYYEPKNIISDMTFAVPASGSYTAAGISSDLRPLPSNPADSTAMAFKADIHGIDSPREGVFIAYEVVNSGYPLAQFQYALHADIGSIGLDAGDLLLADGYISLGEIFDPTPNDDTGFIYVKDISGYSELFFMDNYGSAAQITADGYLNASTSLDSAYDGRAGSGAGREIIADSGAVIIDASGLHALRLDGYLSFNEITDPTNAINTGAVYVKDADGYSELFFMDNYGTVTQITDDGCLAGSSNAAQDNLDSTGAETNLLLTYTPLSSLDTDSGKDLQVYRNGILIRWIVTLGADPNRWTYNSGLNRVEFVASGGSDWYTAIYNRR